MANCGSAASRAEALYEAFLDAFPDHPSYAENQLYFAELLWVRAEMVNSSGELWARASFAFADVVRTHKLSIAQRKDAEEASELARKNAEVLDAREKANP